MADGLYITGIVEYTSNLGRIIEKVKDQAARALYQEALRILEIAKQRVPVKTGALKATGKVSPPVITDKQISVIISFGDEIVDWAIPVHEKMSVTHVSGRSKYLESVILEEMDNVGQRIAGQIKL